MSMLCTGTYGLFECPSGKYIDKIRYANSMRMHKNSTGIEMSTSLDEGFSGNIQVRDYGSNKYILWSIYADTKISLSFDKFDIEFDYDFVSIYYCNRHTKQTEDCTKISTNSGQIIPQTHDTNLGTILIELMSDDSNSKTGFSARWELIFDESDCIPCIENGVSVVEGGEFVCGFGFYDEIDTYSVTGTYIEPYGSSCGTICAKDGASCQSLSNADAQSSPLCISGSEIYNNNINTLNESLYDTPEIRPAFPFV